MTSNNIKKLVVCISVISLLYSNVVFAAIELNSYPTLRNDANLVSYYRLEDTSDSKSTNTLTNNGSVTFVSAKFGNGASLNGSSKYLDSNNSSFNVTGSYTVMGWINVNSLASTQCPITNIVTDANTYGPLYRINVNTNGSVEGVSWASTGSFLVVTSASSLISTGNWYLVGFVKVADNDWRVFLNGSKVASSTASRTLSTTGKNGFRIGANEGSPGSSVPSTSFFNGIVDDVSFFNRALSDSEILNYYNASLASRKIRGIGITR